MKKMKIGIDIRELEKNKLTGIGRFLVDFLSYCSCSRHNEHDREFILFGNQHTDTANSVLEGYKRVVIYEKCRLCWEQIQLRTALKKQKIDIFYSPYPKVPLYQKIKKISSFFDLTYLLVEPYKSRFKSRIYKKWLLDIYVKNSEKIVALSDKSKEDIMNLLKIEPDKISVIYPSVSEQFLPKSEKEIAVLRKKYGIENKYLLYVGNSNPHKNLVRLIDAYNFLSEDIKEEYSLVLAGVGSFFNSQPINFVSGHLPSTVYPLPFISDNDLPTLYSGAAVFIFPSLYEGFGLPPLEAMACGCPVVSSNTSSMPEILGDACLYFNPCDTKDISDKIEQLLKNENMKNELRQRGFERVKLYTVEKMTGRLLEVFECFEK